MGPFHPSYPDGSSNDPATTLFPGAAVSLLPPSARAYKRHRAACHTECRIRCPPDRHPLDRPSGASPASSESSVGYFDRRVSRREFLRESLVGPTSHRLLTRQQNMQARHAGLITCLSKPMPNDPHEAAAGCGSPPVRSRQGLRRQTMKRDRVRTVAPVIHPEILFALSKRSRERQPYVFLTQTSVSGLPGHSRYTCVSQYTGRRWILRWPTPFTCAGSISGKRSLR
jgi:hypothetical protein